MGSVRTYEAISPSMQMLGCKLSSWLREDQTGGGGRFEWDGVQLLGEVSRCDTTNSLIAKGLASNSRRSRRLVAREVMTSDVDLERSGDGATRRACPGA
mmetsp:Transcript_29526/g.77692  ORF Transcript_29526/g.77692 Transcript_29526/m.77692 type:complete len:99 (+) Transcript_29526:1028-1324(+)